MGYGRGRRGCISHVQALEANLRSELGDAAYALLQRRLTGALKAVATIAEHAPELLESRLRVEPEVDIPTTGDPFERFSALLKSIAAEYPMVTTASTVRPPALRLASSSSRAPRSASREAPNAATSPCAEGATSWPDGRNHTRRILRGLRVDRRSQRATAARRGK